MQSFPAKAFMFIRRKFFEGSTEVNEEVVALVLLDLVLNEGTDRCGRDSRVLQHLVDGNHGEIPALGFADVVVAVEQRH